MTTKHQLARDRLRTVLARRAAVRAADLAKELGVSVPTLHRLLQESPEPILVAGKARRTRYALRRPLRGDTADLPLYAVDETGRATLLTRLVTVFPTGCWMPLHNTDWPLADDQRDGWWDGLPYPLYDMRPQGFMGRQLARGAQQSLGVPENPTLWSDDDILFALSRIGTDLPGNLILGDSACERWQQDCLRPVEPWRESDTPTRYLQAAEAALALGLAGSSAAGEFPKFTALRELPGSLTPHVLVKFSGADASPTVTRWSDLLTCEQLALNYAQRLPTVVSARSRIIAHAGRTFLEVERFDRHGRFGRSPLVSLETVNAALMGKDPSDWRPLADALVAARLLSVEDGRRINLIWWFGRLIGNTDMHLGNLSFRPDKGRLSLAPVYDILPMLYAPLAGGELPTRTFEPPLPLPRERDIWLIACQAAAGFWDAVSADARISADFRAMVRDHGTRLWAACERA